MSAPSRTPTTVRHALWLGGLLIVLAGLMGMHGLDNHGAAAMSGHGAGGMDLASHTPMADVSDASVLSGTGDTGTGMAATAMCMAVLVLGLLALLAQLCARRTHSPMWLFARAAPAPAARGRDPDPPSLFSLSIQRC